MIPEGSAFMWDLTEYVSCFLYCFLGTHHTSFLSRLALPFDGAFVSCLSVCHQNHPFPPSFLNGFDSFRGSALLQRSRGCRSVEAAGSAT